jgi:hypothetical protein
MKLSELKTIIKEEFDFTDSNLDERTAREIDIMIDMGHELLKYQNGGYDNEGWDNPEAVFVDVLTTMQEDSSIKGYEKAFKEFVENNMDNNLPNQSSGSFLNALIDLDGLLSTLGYEDDKFTDEQYDAASEYYESRRRELF